MASPSAKAATIAFMAIVFAVGFLLGYYVYGTPSTMTVTIVETIVETKPSTIVETLPITETLITTVTETSIVEKSEYILVDATGVEHRFAEPYERVVSLAPSITETVCLLGCCDRLVGVDDFSNYPPEVNELVEKGVVERIGGYWSPSIEKIVALNPDLVLASSGVPAHRQLAEQLREVGIDVFFLVSDRARTVEDIERDIRSIALLLGCGDPDRLINDIRERINSVQDALSEANVTRVSVLVLLGLPEWGIYAAGGGTFIDYVISLAGGSNAAGKYSGWPMLSKEDVLLMNPDYVIVSAMTPNVTGVYEAWTKALEGLRAIEEGKLCVLTGPANDVLVRPGPRIGIAVQVVASIIHPGLVEAPEGYAEHVYCGGG